MSLAYYPFYAERYEADTTHLTMLEDGAYNRLLRLCWRSPGCKIPDDCAWIYRQMRAITDAEKAAIDTILAEFFIKARGKTWSKKLLEIHAQVCVAHVNKSEAGKLGAAAKALKRAGKDLSNAEATLKQPKPKPKPNKEQQQEGEIQPSKAPDSTDRERLLVAMGADPISGQFGPNGKFLGSVADTEIAKSWTAMGISTERQCAVIAERCAAMRRNNPHWVPGRFAYFTGAMQDLITAKSKPGAASPQDDMAAKITRWKRLGAAK